MSIADDMKKKDIQIGIPSRINHVAIEELFCYIC